MKKITALIIALAIHTSADGQSAWPSETWSSAENLTAVMDPLGLTELSGLFWNENLKLLFVSHGDGRLRVLQLNATNTFTQIANKYLTGGPEGITQADLNTNEYYTIDENNYQVRKYKFSNGFNTITLSNSWDITALPSPMTNTANTGPEGIAFIPDSFLIVSGFISQTTGLPYSSVKGMGGLIFIAHQNQGYVWVFDINPTVNNDFAFVGKYKTNRSESCELSFDRSTGLLYILHNINGNILEVTDLTSFHYGISDRKFTLKHEYFISNPSGNVNVEGFAISSKCTDTSGVKVFLCRDVESVESATYKQDCIRWFNPFNAPGICNTQPVVLNLKLLLNGLYNGNGMMRPFLYNQNASTDPTACDSITVELHQPYSPYTLAETVKGILHTNGNASFEFPPTILNRSYFLCIKNKRSLTIWSKNAYSFTGLVNEVDLIH
jgi:hypothetical protein